MIFCEISYPRTLDDVREILTEFYGNTGCDGRRLLRMLARYPYRTRSWGCIPLLEEEHDIG